MRKTAVILTVKGLLLICPVVLPYLGSPLTQFCVQTVVSKQCPADFCIRDCSSEGCTTHLCCLLINLRGQTLTAQPSPVTRV